MDNRNTKALRYLLLRYLWSNRLYVSQEIYEEVTRTLSVDWNDRKFVVKWVCKGNEHFKEYDGTDFAFFVRGDRERREEDVLRNYRKNLELADRFAREVFNLEPDLLKSAPASFFQDKWLYLTGYALLSLFMLVSGGRPLFVFSLLIMGTFSLEFWYPWGKRLLPAVFLIMLFAGYPVSSMIASAVYFLLQFLDTEKIPRYAAMMLSAAVFFLSLHMIFHKNMDWDLEPWILLFVFAIVASVLIRWTNSSLFRNMPFIFPICCLGLFFDGPFFFTAAGSIFISVLFAFTGPNMVALYRRFKSFLQV
ncbi:MAG: hypothetical protein JW928_01290 [Candidatus Aureabacteria bacterium]|nr:hypothetical protein [Candidatus Auribacterota bacterium]